jgi:hypothetical protein
MQVAVAGLEEYLMVCQLLPLLVALVEVVV